MKSYHKFPVKSTSYFIKHLLLERLLFIRYKYEIQYWNTLYRDSVEQTFGTKFCSLFLFEVQFICFIFLCLSIKTKFDASLPIICWKLLNQLYNTSTLYRISLMSNKCFAFDLLFSKHFFFFKFFTFFTLKTIFIQRLCSGIYDNSWNIPA